VIDLTFAKVPTKRSAMVQSECTTKALPADLKPASQIADARWTPLNKAGNQVSIDRRGSTIRPGVPKAACERLRSNHRDESYSSRRSSDWERRFPTLSGEFSTPERQVRDD
jgi:hypothetical protein